MSEVDSKLAQVRGLNLDKVKKQQKRRRNVGSVIFAETLENS
jgi:hypothetical protein